MLAAMTIKDENFAIDSRRAQTLMAAGGLLGALAASSCCSLPVVLFSLGVSGAWIGNFTQLAPYQPYFLAAALVFVGTGYWLVVATILVMIALGFDFLAPLFLNS
jgi:mercuric ion transport protein